MMSMPWEVAGISIKISTRLPSNSALRISSDWQYSDHDRVHNKGKAQRILLISTNFEDKISNSGRFDLMFSRESRVADLLIFDMLKIKSGKKDISIYYSV